jgi:peroxiredoxin
MRTELDARGVALVAISADTPAQIRAGRAKHGAKATLLADPELAVTTRFGLVNRRGLAPGGLRRLPIPTTLLVDADGMVRWIDQATDYAIRSHPDRVLAAIQRTLGSREAGTFVKLSSSGPPLDGTN